MRKRRMTPVQRVKREKEIISNNLLASKAETARPRELLDETDDSTAKLKKEAEDSRSRIAEMKGELHNARQNGHALHLSLEYERGFNACAREVLGLPPRDAPATSTPQRPQGWVHYKRSF